MKQAALDLGLPVTDAVDDVLDTGADLGVVVAFGRLIRPHVLAALPMVNLHFSLLPRWRGAAPVERAILAGDERTGVDLMVVEEGLDTGGVYDRAEIAIGPDDTADELRARLAAVGATTAGRQPGARVSARLRPQEGEATYAHKIEPDELRIDWTAPGGRRCTALVRVGGAWTTHDGARLKVWRTILLPDRATGTDRGVPEGVDVPVGDGELRLVEVQPEGRRRMAATAWANGLAGDPLAGLGS